MQVGLGVFRVTGGMDDMRSQIQNELYSYLGLDFTTGQAGELLEEDPLDPLAMHENTAIDNSSITPGTPAIPPANGLLTDIEGVAVGHATDLVLGSGVTVIVFDEPAVASGSVLASGSATSIVVGVAAFVELGCGG